MTRGEALAIGRQVQVHPYEGLSLAERIANELLKAYERGLNERMVYFIDIDGTIVKHGTNDLLPGALEMLKELNAAGTTIVFTTRRGDEFIGHPIYSGAGLGELLNSLYHAGVNWHDVVKNIGSPRVLVNDEDCSVIKRETNQAWTE